ncbi:hypothetical protein ACFOY4_04480 [Actinomadura syzygii]|uniref:Uncharacterized protein n=1 Tax=Actinomadura syzygii TaxID=1427538 RepID=A0A5D0TX70_9ACTN|nr:hypothetical protein [Actinomadura syzygii]TYC09956.1 hypothetical protein FXF65_33155 [Actinomadura syzygii]
MALHIGRRRHEPPADEAVPRRSLWRRRTAATDETATAGAGRRRAPRWLRSRHNPVSAMILAAGWAAVVILALGMLLTWGDANPGNTLVDATLDAGRWLATPFHDVFTRSDPDEQLYINWTLAGVVYYALARTLSWMTRS